MTENNFNENVNPDKQSALKDVTLDELLDTVYPPKTPVIEGLLYAGTYLFVGAPKIGKSFLMAQLGIHVSKGIELWDYKVHKGEVLYLALEDDYARLQRRISQMYGVEGTDKFHLVTEAPALSEGLDSQLEIFLKEYPDCKLIIIDTLQKVRKASGELYSYSSDYEVISKLKSFSDKYNVCLLVVHHTRKMESSDAFDMISGTNGLLGAADGAFILHKKKRTDKEAVMEVVGRDQQDQEITLEFDMEFCRWNFVKSETELWKPKPDPVLEQIASLFTEEVKEWQGTSSDLLDLLPEINLKPNALTRKLNISVDRLFNEYGIHYENNRNHEGRYVILKKL